MDQEVKRTFSSQPMVYYKSMHKLNSYLGRSKLYPIERKAGSCKYNGKRCEVCKNILEIHTFTCSNYQTTYEINHKFDCKKKFLGYIITCNKCLNQYVGQTLNMFRSRWNNYKGNSVKFDRREDCMQRHLYKHFRLLDHTGFLIRSILGYPLSMKITEFIPLRQKHLWDLNLKVVTELIPYIVTEQLFLFVDLDGLF